MGVCGCVWICVGGCGCVWICVNSYCLPGNYCRILNLRFCLLKCM